MSFLEQLIEGLPDVAKHIVYERLEHNTQAQIFQAMAQLESDVIRPYITKKGIDSQEYKFFTRLKNIMYQAGEAAHIIERMQAEAHEMNLFNKYLSSKCAELEIELSKYRTIEELTADGALELYIKRVKESMKRKYEQEKKAATQS
jgi:hypothetical protein